jgi:hypothetical protein
MGAKPTWRDVAESEMTAFEVETVDVRQAVSDLIGQSCLTARRNSAGPERVRHCPGMRRPSS